MIFPNPEQFLEEGGGGIEGSFSFGGLTCFSLDWGNSLGKGEHFSDTGFEDISQRVLWYVKDLLKFTKALGLFKCASVYSHWAIVLETAPSGWVPELPKCWTVFFFPFASASKKAKGSSFGSVSSQHVLWWAWEVAWHYWRNIHA